jgi:hypothetical protein
MAYSVYASTAAHFMERFYGALCQLGDVNGAMSVARRALADVGAAAGSHDYMVPVLYTSQDFTVQSLQLAAERDRGRQVAGSVHGARLNAVR